MTPLNQKQGYKEAKVGVIFWSKDHQKVEGKKGFIRQREYVATLKSRAEFRNVEANSPVAPLACGLLRFRAKGKGGAYWYYKWQSPQQIFVTKGGKSSRYKYIGKAGSSAFLEAVEMMRNRTHISALQQVLHTLELGREDLLEEASRTR